MKKIKLVNLITLIVLLISVDAMAQRNVAGQRVDGVTTVQMQGRNIVIQHNAGVDMSIIKADLKNAWEQVPGITTATVNLTTGTTTLEPSNELSKRSRIMLLKGVHPILKAHYTDAPRTKRFNFVKPSSGSKVAGKNAPKDPKVKAFFKRMASAETKAEKQAVRKELRAYRVANRPAINKQNRKRTANLGKPSAEQIAARKARVAKKLAKRTTGNSPKAKARAKRMEKVMNKLK